MQEKPTHFALALGPLYETLLAARSTRAIWTASYLFSWAAQRIAAKHFGQEGVKFLNLPSKADLYGANKPMDYKGIGIFPDRFVAEVATDTTIDWRETVHEVVLEIAQYITNDLNDSQKQRKNAQGERQTPQVTYRLEDIQAYLEDYFRFLAVEFTPTTTNPVREADAFLNAYELHATLPAPQEQDYWSIYFEDLFFNTFLNMEFDKLGFPSTVEISTAAFEQKNPNGYGEARTDLRNYKRNRKNEIDEQTDFLKAVKKIAGDDFGLRHKYIAIVNADGDRFGTLFKKLLDAGLNNAVIEVSDSLVKFAAKSAELIRGFGGVPVYAGGDDLLFFAPVTHGLGKAQRSILDLIHDLDKAFAATILPAIPKDIELGTAPSMSYGISISYYKYPLGESLKTSHDLLHGLKNSEHDLRDGISWRVTKHSGAHFGLMGKKNAPFMLAFKNILESPLAAEQEKDSFLNSIAYKLDDLQGLFRSTAHAPGAHFEHILFNNFDESVHRTENLKTKEKELSPFMKRVLQLLLTAFSNNPVTSTDTDAQRASKTKANLEQAYAALRFTDFLHAKDRD